MLRTYAVVVLNKLVYSVSYVTYIEANILYILILFVVAERGRITANNLQNVDAFPANKYVRKT